MNTIEVDNRNNRELIFDIRNQLDQVEARVAKMEEFFLEYKSTMHAMKSMLTLLNAKSQSPET